MWALVKCPILNVCVQSIQINFWNFKRMSDAWIGNLRFPFFGLNFMFMSRKLLLLIGINRLKLFIGILIQFIFSNLVNVVFLCGRDWWFIQILIYYTPNLSSMHLITLPIFMLEFPWLLQVFRALIIFVFQIDVGRILITIVSSNNKV